MTAASPGLSPQEDRDDGALTVRQREILALLRAGKGNKDIANELGIGLGTVKQHVVAVFRKLKVSSRAEAITRAAGMDWQAQGARAGLLTTPADDSLIEMRPASILSLVPRLPDGGPAPDTAWQGLNRDAAAMAGRFDCTLVALPGAGIDILFGLHRIGEADILAAVEIARELTEEMAASGVSLCAGLTSGFLLASMHRYGGWTGESVAGRAIARARALRDEALPGELHLDEAAKRMLDFSGFDMESPLWHGETILVLGKRSIKVSVPATPQPVRPLVDRITESLSLKLSFNQAAQAGRGLVALVEGEAGMGKTALCRTFLHAAVPGHVQALELACGKGDKLIATLSGLGRRQGRPTSSPGPADAAMGVARALEAGPIFLFLDDIRDASTAETETIGLLAETAKSKPLHLLCASRRLRQGALADLDWYPRLKLARLSETDIRLLVAAVGGGKLDKKTIDDITNLAQGVPLFAVELARSSPSASGDETGVPPPPITLIALVLSRFDPLRLHRGLLRLAARFESFSRARIATLWPAGAGDLDKELDKAVECGVLKLDQQAKTYTFSHPLIREVLRTVLMSDHHQMDRPSQDATAP